MVELLLYIWKSMIMMAVTVTIWRHLLYPTNPRPRPLSSPCGIEASTWTCINGSASPDNSHDYPHLYHHPRHPLPASKSPHLNWMNAKWEMGWVLAPHHTVWPRSAQKIANILEHEAHQIRERVVDLLLCVQSRGFLFGFQWKTALKYARMGNIIVLKDMDDKNIIIARI